MTVGKNNMSVREFYALRRRMSPEYYVSGMSDQIVKELREHGGCEAMMEIVENIREKYLYQDMQAIAIAAIKLSEQLHRAERQREEEQRSVQQVRAEAERMRSEAMAVRRQAEQDAQRIRANAEAEVHRRFAEANARIKQERAGCLESAKREAEQQRERLIEKYRIEAIDVYQELQDRFVPGAVSDAINDYRREDSAAHAAAAEQNRRAVRAFEDARTTFSAGMTGLQAQMNEQLNEMQNRLSRSMMDWREQLYRLETMDLAQCAVNLSTIINGVDKRVGDAAVQGDQHTVESLSAVRRNLSRFEKQFRNALTTVGLQVYQPQPGDDFDPARHVLSEAEKDADPDQPLTVSGCIRPGVLGSSGSGVEALIRAEVAAREKPAPQPPVLEQTFRPLFNQIIPGGDQG